ncbi:transglutaminase-like domain-containing protein [Paenibacillus sp. PAMC21692]|uniref:transglutaminase-like domain-containing protein n=1 Tax=Paenibacillus sp. PAMC21692 TaxID=2762320 RepID=UPI00164D001C|nr:transglutaminase-like domain-containing protein [Paenibacillus sp. PAMC21692]QNK58186.1 transglutaminase domain-containing protein [Paenibacillus sp. PAMC21692]
MRKFIMMVVSVFLLFTSVQAVSAADAGAAWLDTSALAQGVVKVTYDVKPKVKMKVMIAKGKDNYTYNLATGRVTETLPLQLGNGEYKIMLLENISGTSYKAVKQQAVKLNLKDEKVVYLNSVQNVSWTSTSQAIAKAKELAKGKKTDEEKAKAVYNYIIANIAYDKVLADTVTSDYLPSIDKTLASKKAICYGYASTYAAMLRSLDIPTKLIMGDSDYVDVYHAWNEVYLNGKWVIVDTTVDAGIKQSNKATVFAKDASKYTKTKQY